MTETLSTWREVVADADAWIADAIESGDLDPRDEDAVEEWIHETADGCGHVIYTANSRSLWADPCSPDLDDEALSMTGGGSIQDAVTIYAYLAVTQALREAVERAIEDLDDEDADA